MPGATPTLKEAVSDRKLRPVLMAWATRLHNEEQLEFIVDVLDHKPPKFLYQTYIAETSPKLINLDAVKFLKPIRQVVTRDGEAAYAKITRQLVEAGDEMFGFLKGTYDLGKDGFLVSPEYQKHVSGGVERDPKVAAALATLQLTGSKAQSFEPLLKVYLAARTITDAGEAYAAMQKIAPKAKLDVALKATGGKSIADMEAEALAVKNAALAVKLVPAIKTELTTAKTYLTSALATVKTKGKPKNPVEVTRMFTSGRTRMEKLNTAYVKAVKLDKAFATKNATLAAEKKKVDEQWAEYRKLLGLK